MIRNNSFAIAFHLVWCLLCLSSSEHVPDLTRHPNWHLLDHENCGTSMSDRIIGGKNATLGQFPWLARIGYNKRGYKNLVATFRCGGALINNMYVLTAAHCTSDLPDGIYVSMIRLGENNAKTSVDCEDSVCADPVQDIPPSTVIVHKYHNRPAYRNDIALVRLSRAATINGWVQPICLPYGAQLMKHYEDSKAQVAGWGVYDISKPRASDYLLYVTLPIVNRERCQNAFRKYANIDRSQLCVGGVVGEDSCGGDSGGPLVQVDASHGTPKYYVIGIVSFGPKHCGATKTPAVYTNMGSFGLWVLNNMLP